MPDPIKQFHPDVEEVDLVEIASDIAKDNSDAARRVVTVIHEWFGTLAAQPEMGTLYHPARRTLRGVRMIPVLPYRNYLIFYRPLPNKEGVRILYVLHAARDIATFLREHQRR